MDRGTSIRAYHAAGDRSAGGQFQIEMGKTETIYDWGSSDCGYLSVGIGMDGGNRANICDGAGDGWSLDSVDRGFELT